MFARLRVAQGDSKGMVLSLEAPVFRIGLTADCHYRPRDLSVSDRHCELLVGAASLSLRDLDSRGGTWLNGLRIVPDCRVKVRHGDRIGVGRSAFDVAPGEEREGAQDTAAAAAARLLQRRLGPAAITDEAALEFVHSTDLAGVPVRSVELPRITDEADLEKWRSILRALSKRLVPGRVVLDLRAVRACSTEALDALLAFRERTGRSGVTLSLCGVEPNVQRVIDEAGASEALPTYRDASVAVWSGW